MKLKEKVTNLKRLNRSDEEIKEKLKITDEDLIRIDDIEEPVVVY